MGQSHSGHGHQNELTEIERTMADTPSDLGFMSIANAAQLIAARKLSPLDASR
jgi:hypothetical protein